MCPLVYALLFSMAALASSVQSGDFFLQPGGNLALITATFIEDHRVDLMVFDCARKNIRTTSITGLTGDNVVTLGSIIEISYTTFVLGLENMECHHNDDPFPLLRDQVRKKIGGGVQKSLRCDCHWVIDPGS